MSKISEALQEIKEELPEGVALLAVSKFHPAETVREAYDAGQRLFGENRPQEMTAKYGVLPKDIQWHMIGHLQTNKVKMIVPYVSMIESVDSEKLLCEINKHAMNAGRVVPVLLEIHVAAEETKQGFTPDECKALVDSDAFNELHNIEVSGLMCMASNTNDEVRVHEDFKKVHALWDELKNSRFAESSAFKYRSWGMSGDYKIAIEEGSNIIRIGTKIFGEREAPRQTLH